MATNQRTRVLQSTLDSDQAVFMALKTLPDYAPNNPALSMQSVGILLEKLRSAQEAEFHANNALAAARDANEAVRLEFHTTMLKVKTAILAQYGPDADAVQAIGLKKKSNYRRSGRRRSETTPS